MRRALDRPVVLLFLLGARVVGVEDRAVCLEREDEAEHVADQQHDRHAEGERLEVRAEVHALLADARQPAAVDQLEDRREDQSGEGQHQHRGLGVGGGAAEGLLVARQPSDHHRGPHHEQDVADDRAHDRRLDDLLKALVQGEEGDDQLGRVAEGHVQEAADARSRLGGDRLGRLAHHGRAGDHAERGGAEDEHRVRVGELQRYRRRDEDAEVVDGPHGARSLRVRRRRWPSRGAWPRRPARAATPPPGRAARGR